MRVIFLLMLVLAAFVCAADLDVKKDIYAYELRFERLPNGTLPEGIISIALKDSVKLSWKQPAYTRPLSEQVDGFTFGEGIDVITKLVLNDAALYAADGSSVAIVQAPLTSGEWQLQIRSSRKNTEGKVLWSKFSDAFGFKLVSQDDPFGRPVQVMIVF